jgi:hypothetical protein
VRDSNECATAAGEERSFEDGSSPQLSLSGSGQAVLAVVLLAIDIAVRSIECAIQSGAFAKSNVAIAARKAFCDADAGLLPFESYSLTAGKLAAANAFANAGLLAMLTPIYASH